MTVTLTHSFLNISDFSPGYDLGLKIIGAKELQALGLF